MSCLRCGTDLTNRDLCVDCKEVINLKIENAKLQTRQAELLQTIVKITRETPYPAELDECRSNRAALIAEVGTLKAKLVESHEAAAELGILLVKACALVPLHWQTVREREAYEGFLTTGLKTIRAACPEILEEVQRMLARPRIER